MRSLKLFPYLLLLIFLSACTPTSQLDEAERQWQAQQIASYKIEVLEINSIWHAQYQSLTVENGVITEQTARCTPAPFEGQTCEVQPFDPEAFTVPGLFAKARAVTATADADSFTIRYDDTYFYPMQISFNDPEIVDEDWSWAVTSFEVLKP